jgi:hypothetical protein
MSHLVPGTYNVLSKVVLKSVADEWQNNGYRGNFPAVRSTDKDSGTLMQYNYSIQLSTNVVQSFQSAQFVAECRKRIQSITGRNLRVHVDVDIDVDVDVDIDGGEEASVLDYAVDAHAKQEVVPTALLYHSSCLDLFIQKPKLYDYLDVFSASRSTFGMPFQLVGQGYGDKLFLEYILQRHPEFVNIVEFGTFTGITSLSLGMTATLRGGHFTTFDVVDQRMLRVKNAGWLNSTMKFVQADLENVNKIDARAKMAVQSTDLLFNDGGNKDVEAKLYAGFLPRGAGYFQHDFSYSLDPKVQKGWFASSYSLKPMYEDVGKMFNSCGRFWIVV